MVVGYFLKTVQQPARSRDNPLAEFIKTDELCGSAGLCGEVRSLVCIPSLSVSGLSVLMEDSIETIHFEHHSKYLFPGCRVMSLLEMKEIIPNYAVVV